MEKRPSAADSVRRHLDVSTGNLPAKEFEIVSTRACDSLIVRPHAYGAWVHVPYDDLENHDVSEELPALHTLLAVARALDCHWINFDQNADALEGALYWEW